MIACETDSAAFRIAAIEAGHAAVHQHHGRSAALQTKLGAFGKVRLGEGVLLLAARFIFSALLIDEFLLMFIKLVFLEKTDRL